MRLKLFLTALLACVSSAWAKNTTTEVKQVTESVQITDDVDYVITDATPFGAMGSVDILNTENAVVIIKNIKPSVVISKWLKNHVFINGVQATNGTNCQVRMFNRGAIIFPHGNSYKPLTCYTEPNYEGKSYNGYTEGSNNGFMRSLTATQLNNSIQSFKLKRGYMVTFCVGKDGWGYSRCFIADMEDLEIPVMPAPFKGSISSYRLFQWYNASKAGVHHTGKEANAALRTTSCFDWGQGNASLLPDVEWISHHIYEDWPSASTCGGVSQTCHMKTNNEPGNSADDHPQDVATVLNNWQNLMRTGMRLCSESSHDGSMGHLKEFITEIDKRGWRCDILDLHCYWDGQWNSLDWYISEYGQGRPCWISEWVWGASWSGGSGAFANGRQNDDATYNGTVPILERLNRTSKVERYFYWNSEAWYTQIYRDNALTKLGKYYAEMDVPLAFNEANQYVPKVVFNAPSDITASYNKNTKQITLNWTDPNGDMLDSIVVQYQAPGTTKWVNVSTVPMLDKSGSGDCAYKHTLSLEPQLGANKFQVVEYYTQGTTKKTFKTNTYTVTVAAANNTGLVQYGHLEIGNTDVLSTEIAETDTVPYVIMGMMSNKNSGNGITNQVQSITKTAFKFRFYPWQLDAPVEFKNAETVDYLILPSDTVMHLPNDMMLISQNAGSIKDSTRIVFPEAFPEGVTPIVVAQQICSTTSYKPVTVKIINVTNEYFDVKLVRQAGETATFNKQKVVYYACSPGQISIGGGKLLSAARNNVTPVGGSTRQTVEFLDKDGQQMALTNPVIIAMPQTDNFPAASIFRVQSYSKDDNGNIISQSTRRQIDGTATDLPINNAKTNGDYIGYIIVSDDPNGSPEDEPIITAIRDIAGTKVQGFSVSTAGRMILTNGKNVNAYSISGHKVALGKPVPAGVYVVTDGKKSVKVVVK